MKIISVKTKDIIVDDDVYDRIKSLRLEIYRHRKHSYSYVYVFMPARQLLHRYILGLVPYDGIVTDHINRNTLDNRRENLRQCTHAQNLRNQPKNVKALCCVITSKYKGVYWAKNCKKYFSSVRFRKRRVGLLYSVSELECAYAYDCANLLLAPEFSYINNVQLESLERALEIKNLVKKKLNL